MEKLPNTVIIDNVSFIVYSCKKYPEDFVNRLNDVFTKQRQKILNYFDLENYSKIRINLFDNIENLNQFSSKYISISPYHKGDCCGNMVNYFCDDTFIDDYSKAGYIIASLAHEFVHMVYHDTLKGIKCVWLEEGLATYLSEQKGFLERDFERYKAFLKKIINEKEIPKLDFLNKRGGKYGEFVDCETNKYNGYDFAYGLVRYLNESKGKKYINDMIFQPKNLIDEEKTIIQDFIKYAKIIIEK